MEKAKIKSPRFFLIAICIAAAVVIIGCMVFMTLNGKRITEENRAYLKDNTSELATTLLNLRMWTATTITSPADI